MPTPTRPVPARTFPADRHPSKRVLDARTAAVETARTERLQKAARCAADEAAELASVEPRADLDATARALVERASRALDRCSSWDDAQPALRAAAAVLVGRERDALERLSTSIRSGALPERNALPVVPHGMDVGAVCFVETLAHFCSAETRHGVGSDAVVLRGLAVQDLPSACDSGRGLDLGLLERAVESIEATTPGGEPTPEARPRAPRPVRSTSQIRPVALTPDELCTKLEAEAVTMSAVFDRSFYDRAADGRGFDFALDARIGGIHAAVREQHGEAADALLCVLFARAFLAVAELAPRVCTDDHSVATFYALGTLRAVVAGEIPPEHAWEAHEELVGNDDDNDAVLRPVAEALAEGGQLMRDAPRLDLGYTRVAARNLIRAIGGATSVGTEDALRAAAEVFVAELEGRPRPPASTGRRARRSRADRSAAGSHTVHGGRPSTPNPEETPHVAPVVSLEAWRTARAA